MKTLDIELVEDLNEYDGLCDSVALLDRDPAELARDLAREHLANWERDDPPRTWVRWAVRGGDGEILAEDREYVEI